MSDFRAYCTTLEVDPVDVRLSPEESHHLVSVNRCGRGDVVIAFDGHGREWTTECKDASKSATILHVKGTHRAKPRTCEITLAQALPKGPAMDDIIRQATEIGVAQIIPLLSERTQVHFDGDRAEKKIEKWRTTAIEAAKQCGNPWLPDIAPLQPLASWLQRAAAVDLKLVASLHVGATSLKNVLASYRTKHGQTPRKVIALVGPEGDFSPAEMTAALTAGFHPITLGPLVLRSDTAATYVTSILSYELGHA